MPTAERRRKQKAAQQRAIEAVETATGITRRTSSRSVSTQTNLDAGIVKEIIEKYWNKLDSRGIDQQTETFQFTIGSFSTGLHKGPPSEAFEYEDDELGYQDFDVEEYLRYLEEVAQTQETGNDDEDPEGDTQPDNDHSKPTTISDKSAAQPPMLDGMD